jgi:hypothetical protein
VETLTETKQVMPICAANAIKSKASCSVPDMAPILAPLPDRTENLARCGVVNALLSYGYTRGSTDRQADEGESLGAQQRTLEGHAMMRGMRIDRLFIERGVSGSKKLSERPCGSELLATVRAGDVVLTQSSIACSALPWTSRMSSRLNPPAKEPRAICYHVAYAIA